MEILHEISIVIVNYNTYPYTAQCVDSIYTNAPNKNYEIIIVDNASKDDSAKLIAQKYPGVKLVLSDRNKGIAGGNNLGIRASTGQYILLLNNDTIVLPKVIDRCVDFIESHPQVAGVGGNLLNPDGSFQSGACNFPTIFDEVLHLSKLGALIKCLSPTRSFSIETEVDWMSTAFMLFRRKALEQIDLVDELFFIYSDETDLEYRLCKAGWKIYYLPDVNTIHFGGKSLTPWKSRPLIYRGRLLFFRKHHPWYAEMIVRLMYIFSSIIKLMYWCVNYLIPDRRNRAINELKSHFEVLKYSINLKFFPIL